MSVRLDDVTANVSGVVAAALAAVSVTLRSPAMRAGGIGEPSGDWASLEVRLAGSVRRAPDEALAAQGTVTLYTRATGENIYRPQAVVQALRAALVAQNLAVYGTTSGAPGVLQGIVQVVDFTSSVLGDLSDEVITEATFSLMERT